MKTGAYCLGAGFPPASEVQRIALRSELRVRADPVRVIVPAQGIYDESASMMLQYLPRTILPLSWFSGEVVWELYLARRWRRPIRLQMGEHKS
jgi:hypothetical protein